MKIQPLAWAFFFMTAISANAGERLTIAVSPLQSFAPTTLMVRVRVPPDDANRALEVSADSGDYYRSSRIQLNGRDAPRIVTLEFRGLPGGEYQIRTTLVDGAGHALAFVRERATVLSSAAGG